MDLPNVTSSRQDKFKKTGNAGIKGVMFQIQVLTVCFLKSIMKFKKWKLSSENSLAGKFDDVVLEREDGAILIQTKYRQNRKITFDELLPSNYNNDDFNLVRYLLSYREVKAKFQVTNAIICTNATITVNADRQKFLNSHNATSESILHCQDRDCRFYTFNKTIIPPLKKLAREYLRGKDDSEITDEDIEDFLNHLQFYYDYPSGTDLKNIMEQLLTQMRLSSAILRKISLQDILNNVNEWYEQPRGDCEYLTEASANAMFSVIRSDKYCEKLNQYNVLFENNDLDFEGTKRVFHISADNGYLLHVIKIFRALRYRKKKVLFIKPDDDAEIQEQVVKAFDVPCYEFLIIISPKISPQNILGDIYTKLKRTLERYKYKKVVLVTRNDDKLMPRLDIDNSIYEIVDIRVKFEDFLKETQASLLEKKKIVFQQHKISLKELYGEKTSNYGVLSPNIWEKIVKDEEIVISPSVQFENVSGLSRSDTDLTSLVKDRQMVKFVDKQTLVEQKVDLLFGEGDMIELPTEKDEGNYENSANEVDGRSLLPLSASNDDFGIVKWFLEYGTLVDIGNEFGNKSYYSYITSR